MSGKFTAAVESAVSDRRKSGGRFPGLCDVERVTHVASWLDASDVLRKRNLRVGFLYPVDDGDESAFFLRVDGEPMFLEVRGVSSYLIEWRWRELEDLEDEERPPEGPQRDGKCGFISTSGYTRAAPCKSLEEVVTLLTDPALREAKSHVTQPGHSDFYAFDLFG
jgi:hypothetical protein